MHQRISRAVVLLATVVLFCAPSFSQPEQPRGYVLYRVASGKNRVFNVPFRPPVLIEADASGGKLVADMEFSSTCSETVTFTWEFDKDIRFLRPDEAFVVTMTGGVSGDCGRDHYCMASSGLITRSIQETMSEEEQDEHSGLITDPDQPENLARMMVKEEGTGTTRFVVRSGRRNSPRVHFYINFRTSAGREACSWQIAYLYRAVYDDTEPGDVEIELDEPAGDSETTVTIPAAGDEGGADDDAQAGDDTDDDEADGSDDGQGTGQTGPIGGGAGDGLCPDPSLNPCIQQWMDRVSELRNRKMPDRAPWGFSRYGQTSNSLTISFLPPDGWETKYDSSRYCYVWLNNGREHLDPVYDGELQSLYEMCADGEGPGVPPEVDQDPRPEPRIGSADVNERTLLAERRLVEAGDIVTVPVRLLNPDGVANINFEVTYDSAVVAVESIVRGSVLGGQRLFESNPGQSGRVRIGFAGQAGLNADGIVANIAFRAVGSPGDRTPLTLRVTDIDDPNGSALPISLVNGEVVITGPGGRVPGDCDGDGTLTAADAICALKMSVGLRDVDLTLDANSDGQVTSGDARTILQQIP